jgi:hypothetical protein
MASTTVNYVDIKHCREPISSCTNMLSMIGKDFSVQSVINRQPRKVVFFDTMYYTWAKNSCVQSVNISLLGKIVLLSIRDHYIWEKHFHVQSVYQAT